MIKEIHLQNWKSFEKSTLYIDPLTFIIGTNASGKSNILDALYFLCGSAKGIPLNDLAQKTRGGVDWLIRKGTDSFTLAAVIDDESGDLVYTLTCRKNDTSLQLVSESLEQTSPRASKTLFATDITHEDTASSTLPVLFSGKQKPLDLNRQTTILSQMENLVAIRKVKESALLALNNLRNIFILNPVPDRMRDYAPLTEQLNADAGNLAGLLAGMNPEDQHRIEKELTDYVRPLPEKDLKRIWAETVGRFRSDAMLYCEEEWVNGEKIEIDARSMSDGTLRFIAIVAALLTGKPGSLLVIEEVDNGLHPSRAQELVNVLNKLGEKSQIDIICTTHNPVLIDTLGHEMIPFISYVSRSEKSGCSVISLLEEKNDLAKLMARGSVGDLMTEDAL